MDRGPPVQPLRGGDGVNAWSDPEVLRDTLPDVLCDTLVGCHLRSWCVPPWCVPRAPASLEHRHPEGASAPRDLGPDVRAVPGNLGAGLALPFWLILDRTGQAL